MGHGSDSDNLINSIDISLKSWSQGDCTLGEHWFMHRFDPQLPLTKDSQKVIDNEVDSVETEVEGFAVVTQTCDIVRKCSSRPFLEVVPLVKIVDGDTFNEICKGRRPQYAFIPGISEKQLVADLDRVMTVEKTTVLSWERIPGCSTDKERRAFSQALSRKRSRFAFPDDFIRLTGKLQSRLREKHSKESLEGKALRSLREIRVSASPSWNAEVVSLMFWYIRDVDVLKFEGVGWHEFLGKWLDLVPHSGRFQEIEGQIVTIEDLSAKDYIESDPLDLDHLSTER